MGKLRVSLAKLIVRDISINLSLMEVLHIRFTGKAGIRRDHCTCLVDIFGNPQPSKALLNALQHRGQCVMLLPLTKGLPIRGLLCFKNRSIRSAA